MIPVRPKHWSVRAVSVTGDPLRLTCNDRLFEGKTSSITPVEYLLISVASCFALSCRMALEERALGADSLAVSVRGSKALDAPSRLGRIDIEVELPNGLARDAGAIVRRTEQLCTVTNTLAQALKPQVQVRTG
jgi:uncharacterized OsmC-like protein